MRRILFLLPILILGILGALLAAGLERGPRPAAPTAVGKPMPGFELPPLPGREAGLSDAMLRGKPALINIFASWCGYCRAEHPALAALARETGIPFHGIAWRDDPKQTEKYLADLGDPYRSIGMDRSGRGVIAWGITGTPETFVVDASGTIRYHHAGPLLGEEIERRLKPLLKTLE